jgi:hypothetical protein
MMAIMRREHGDRGNLGGKWGPRSKGGNSATRGARANLESMIRKQKKIANLTDTATAIQSAHNRRQNKQKGKED